MIQDTHRERLDSDSYDYVLRVHGTSETEADWPESFDPYPDPQWLLRVAHVRFQRRPWWAFWRPNYTGWIDYVPDNARLSERDEKFRKEREACDRIWRL